MHRYSVVALKLFSHPLQEQNLDSEVYPLGLLPPICEIESSYYTDSIVSLVS